MRKFNPLLQRGPDPRPLRGPSLKEIAARSKLPVTHDELYKEGAALRDADARIYEELARIGARLYELEQQIDLEFWRNRFGAKK